MLGGSLEVCDIMTSIERVRPNPWGLFRNGSRDFAVDLKGTIDDLGPLDWRSSHQQASVYAHIAAYTLTSRFFREKSTWQLQVDAVEKFTLLLGRKMLGDLPEAVSTKYFMSRAIVGTEPECIGATYEQLTRVIRGVLLGRDFLGAETNEIPESMPELTLAATTAASPLRGTPSESPALGSELVDQHFESVAWSDTDAFLNAEQLPSFLSEMRSYLEEEQAFLFHHGTPAECGPGGAIGWLLEEIEMLLPEYIRIGNRVLSDEEFVAIVRNASVVAPDELWLLCDKGNPRALSQLATFLGSHVPIPEVAKDAEDALAAA